MVHPHPLFHLCRSDFTPSPPFPFVQKQLLKSLLHTKVASAQFERPARHRGELTARSRGQSIENFPIGNTRSVVVRRHSRVCRQHKSMPTPFTGQPHEFVQGLIMFLTPSSLCILFMEQVSTNASQLLQSTSQAMLEWHAWRWRQSHAPTGFWSKVRFLPPHCELKNI